MGQVVKTPFWPTCVFTGMMQIKLLVGGIPTPLKNMKVSRDDEIPNIWKNKSHVPKHHLFSICMTRWQCRTLTACCEGVPSYTVVSHTGEKSGCFVAQGSESMAREVRWIPSGTCCSIQASVASILEGSHGTDKHPVCKNKALEVGRPKKYV